MCPGLCVHTHGRVARVLRPGGATGDRQSSASARWPALAHGSPGAARPAGGAVGRCGTNRRPAPVARPNRRCRPLSARSPSRAFDRGRRAEGPRHRPPTPARPYPARGRRSRPVRSHACGSCGGGGPGPRTNASADRRARRTLNRNRALPHPAHLRQSRGGIRRGAAEPDSGLTRASRGRRGLDVPSGADPCAATVASARPSLCASLSLSAARSAGCAAGLRGHRQRPSSSERVRTCRDRPLRVQDHSVARKFVRSARAQRPECDRGAPGASPTCPDPPADLGKLCCN